MSTKTAEITEMLDILPESDFTLAYEIIKKMVLAWDPDFTKLTESERARLEQSEKDPEFVDMDDIDWE